MSSRTGLLRFFVFKMSKGEREQLCIGQHLEYLSKVTFVIWHRNFDIFFLDFRDSPDRGPTGCSTPRGSDTMMIGRGVVRVV